MKINNKGELTTQQIVGIIILITSFVIILFLLFRLNLGAETNQEICRNSVILKGGSPLPGNAVSLNCHKNYECITSDGTCDGLTKPDKTLKANSAEEVYQGLAGSMANCWWMFGEGKIDYVQGETLKNNYCSICSQVLLDNSLGNIQGISDGKIDKDGFYDYLSRTKMPRSDKTYLEYIFGTNDLVSLKRQIMESANNTGRVQTFGNLNVNKQYFVVMGITSSVSEWKWAFGGAGAGAVTTGIAAVLGVVSLATPPGWIAGALIVAGGVAGGVAGAKISETIQPEILALTLEGRGISNRFMAPTIVEIDSEKFKALNCEDILTFS